MDELNVLEESLKSGMEVEPFLSSYKALFPLIHEAGLTDDFRQGRKSCKRLRAHYRTHHSGALQYQ